jgi:hypothetical protein
MNQTQTHLMQLAYVVALVGVALDVTISLFDVASRTTADVIHAAAPVLLYGFSLWLMRSALFARDEVQ